MFPSTQGSFKHVIILLEPRALSGSYDEMTLLFFAGLFVSVFSEVHGQNPDYGWKLLDVRLPKKLSDHSASAGPSGLIYIAGGCGESLYCLNVIKYWVVNS